MAPNNITNSVLDLEKILEYSKIVRERLKNLSEFQKDTIKEVSEAASSEDALKALKEIEDNDICS